MGPTPTLTNAGKAIGRGDLLGRFSSAAPSCLADGGRRRKQVRRAVTSELVGRRRPRSGGVGCVDSLRCPAAAGNCDFVGTDSLRCSPSNSPARAPQRSSLWGQHQRRRRRWTTPTPSTSSRTRRAPTPGPTRRRPRAVTPPSGPPRTTTASGAPTRARRLVAAAAMAGAGAARREGRAASARCSSRPSCAAISGPGPAPTSPTATSRTAWRSSAAASRVRQGPVSRRPTSWTSLAPRLLLRQRHRFLRPRLCQLRRFDASLAVRRRQ